LWIGAIQLSGNWLQMLGRLMVRLISLFTLLQSGVEVELELPGVWV